MAKANNELNPKSNKTELSDSDLESVSGGYVSIVYAEGTRFKNINHSNLFVEIICAIYVDPNNNNNNRYRVKYWDYSQRTDSVEKEYTHAQLREDGFRSTL